MRFLISNALRDEYCDGPAMPAEVELLRQRIEEVIRLEENDSSQLKRFEKPLESYRARRLIRVNLGGGNARLDAAAGSRRLYYDRSDSALTFLCVGDHDHWLGVPSSEIDHDLSQLLQDPVDIPDELLIAERRSGVVELPPLADFEVRPEWIYRLDAAQQRIAKEVNRRVQHEEPSFDLVIGGPGTGKTAVLAWLINKAVLRGDTSMKLHLSEAVATYMSHVGTWSRLQFDFRGHQGPWGAHDNAEILFVDDPDGFFDLVDYADAIDEGRVRHVVVAVDFQQLDDMWTDDEIAEFLKRTRAVRSRLGTCYRQKSEIGTPVKDILDAIAESTPSNRKDAAERHYRDHRLQWKDSNDLLFTNPGGTYVVRDHHQDELWASLADAFRSELDRGALWDWSPPILILVSDRRGFPPGGLELFDGLPTEVRSLNDYRAFKGLEFQHEIVLLTRDEWSLLRRIQQGRPQAFHQQRLSRIALTRARDSLTIIVG